MQADDVACREQLVFLDARDAGFDGGSGGEILAPGDDVHFKSLCDARNFSPDLAEADDAERAVIELDADAALPTALAGAAVLLWDVANGGEHQRDGEFRRSLMRAGMRAGMA